MVGSNYLNDIINETRDIIFSDIAQSSLIEVNLLPTNLINTTIALYDAIGNQLTNITVRRNSTAKSICSYNSNMTLIYCAYSVNTYDDLNDVKILFNLEFQSKTYTVTFMIDRTQDYSFSTQPQSFTVNDVNDIKIITTNATYYNSTIKTYTQPSAFSLTLRNNYDYLSCTYGSIGCNLVRTYNNANGISDFTNYYDYTICVNSLNNENIVSTTEDFLGGSGLSQGIKYLIVLFTVLTILIGFTALGFMMKMIQASFIVGSIISVFALIIFTVFGWISWIIIVMMLIVAIAVIILISKTNTNIEHG